MSHIPPYPPNPPEPVEQPPDPKPPRRRAWLVHGATAFVALVVGIAIGSATGSGGKKDSAAPAPTVTVTESANAEPSEPEPAVTVTEEVTVTPKPAKKPKPAQKSGPATTVAGDGDYLVGDDMQAGTYKTAGPDKGNLVENCYWARTKDASGEVGSIIANDNLQGQGRVTVNKGEYFKTQGCQKWTKVG